MKIVSFQTYLKGDHPTISIGTLETSTGETTSQTFGLSEYWINGDGDVVYEDRGKDRSPSYPADRYLKNADYLVRYTGEVLLVGWRALMARNSGFCQRFSERCFRFATSLD